jgi:hypothetical protein
MTTSNSMSVKPLLVEPRMENPPSQESTDEEWKRSRA